MASQGWSHKFRNSNFCGTDLPFLGRFHPQWVRVRPLITMTMDDVDQPCAFQDEPYDGGPRPYREIEEILIANKGTIPELSFGLRLAGAKIGVA